MPREESFDVTTGCDLQEVDNALNQARREIANRFDFKNVVAEIQYDRQHATFTIHTADDYKLSAIWQVLDARFVARDVPLQNVAKQPVEKAGGSTVRQEVRLTQGIDGDTARRIVRDIKDQKYKKVQAQVQGDAVRVSGPSRDELQQVIRFLKTQDYAIELKFGNFR